MKIKNWHQFSIFDFKRKLNGRMTHGPSRSSPWDMSCPRNLVLDERKSMFERKSVFRGARMQPNLGVMFERKAKISCNDGRSVTKNLRARNDCMRTSRKTGFHHKNETSAGLKITSVDMTYPGQRPELPSLLLLSSEHTLLFLRLWFQNLIPGPLSYQVFRETGPLPENPLADLENQKP